MRIKPKDANISLLTEDRIEDIAKHSNITPDDITALIDDKVEYSLVIDKNITYRNRSYEQLAIKVFKSTLTIYLVTNKYGYRREVLLIEADLTNIHPSDMLHNLSFMYAYFYNKVQLDKDTEHVTSDTLVNNLLTSTDHKLYKDLLTQLDLGYIKQIPIELDNVKLIPYSKNYKLDSNIITYVYDIESDKVLYVTIGKSIIIVKSVIISISQDEIDISISPSTPKLLAPSTFAYTLKTFYIKSLTKTKASSILEDLYTVLTTLLKCRVMQVYKVTDNFDNIVRIEPEYPAVDNVDYIDIVTSTYYNNTTKSIELYCIIKGYDSDDVVVYESDRFPNLESALASFTKQSNYKKYKLESLL